MLSRLFAVPIPSSTRSSTHQSRSIDWDIFCTVIDNFGDIGVCWRLARQLEGEHGLTVRLWVDDLVSFQRICPEVDPRKALQMIQGIEVRHWPSDFPDLNPCDVVIEAFACHLPERFINTMATRKPSPVWINLDYLSAEAWVSGCHALPSPHPRLPLTKYFFFPGFDNTTGGLLRERDLATRKESFCASSEQQIDFWNSIDQPQPSADTLLISLFSYENAAIKDLLSILAQSETPICCLAPLTRSLSDIENFAGQSLSAGDIIHKNRLELRVLPFVSQANYDRLLWSCDINLVRGEDSFVRAQWAEKPMLWQIYPQQEDAHLVKLDAFLDLFLAGLSQSVAEPIRRFYRAWNGQGLERLSPELWSCWMKNLPDIRKHSEDWTKRLLNQQDLCSNLVNFARSQL